MTAEDFRRIALSMPDAIEASHMGHPDFRVGNGESTPCHRGTECRF
jgi:hypothetical protein